MPARLMQRGAQPVASGTGGLERLSCSALSDTRAAMTATTALRLRFAALALLVEALHLGWEATHGGIVSHHLLQRADLPGLSNAWGLLVLPAIAAWAAGRWPARPAARWPFLVGFGIPLVAGLALSAAFQAQLQPVTEAIFFGMLIAALLLPAHRRECLLGFVLGMSWTFGALLPTLIGGVIATLSWLLRGIARWAWTAVGPA